MFALLLVVPLITNAQTRDSISNDTVPPTIDGDSIRITSVSSNSDYSNAYEIALGGLPLFAYSAIFFAMNVAIIGYYQATEQNTRATLCMLFRGLIFLVPAFILMPKFIFPQGMWLAVPVTECITLGVILLTNKHIISR